MMEIPLLLRAQFLEAENVRLTHKAAEMQRYAEHWQRLCFAVLIETGPVEVSPQSVLQVPRGMLRSRTDPRTEKLRVWTVVE